MARDRRTGRGVPALLAAALASAALLPAGAGAAFTATHEATAAGYPGPVIRLTSSAASDTLVITVRSGVLSHNQSGGGYASNRDFDSADPGVQGVGDQPPPTLLVRSGRDGSVRLRDLDRGEIGYAFSAPSYPHPPGCVLRDPGREGGSVGYGGDGEHEVQICFVKGIARVTVSGGPGDSSFGVLDTRASLAALRLDGGGGDDSALVAGPVPSGFGPPHTVKSRINFTGGAGSDHVALLDQGDGRGSYLLTAKALLVTSTRQPRIKFDRSTENAQLYVRSQGSSAVLRRNHLAVQLFGGDGPDVVDATRAGAGVFLSGGDGDDVLKGSGRSDLLDGGEGNDTLIGGGGFDSVYGQGGRDRLLIRDRGPDFFECGSGRDLLLRDPIDALRRGHGCERIRNG